MSIRLKLLFSVLLMSILVFGSTIFYIGYNEREASIDEAREMALTYAREYANLISSKLNTDVGVTRAMSNFLVDVNSIAEEERDTAVYRFLASVLTQNKNIYTTWVSFELSAIDTTYTKPYGRKRFLVYYDSDKNPVLQKKILNLDGDDEGGEYYRAKKTKREMVTDPYFDTFDNEKVLVTSVGHPIIINDKFCGLAGIDIHITEHQEIIRNFKPFEVGFATMISYNGIFITFPEKEYIGKSFLTNDSLFKDIKYIGERIKKGDVFSLSTFYESKETYMSFAPVHYGVTNTPWTVAVVIPSDRIQRTANKRLITITFASVLALIILTIIVLFASSRLTKPLRNITLVLNDLAKGILKDTRKMIITTNDEIGRIKKSVNSLIDALTKTAGFANEIGKGNYESEFETLGKRDILGSSLLDMRESLKRAKEFDAKARQDSEIRNWTVQGVAKFSELLRENSNNIDVMSFEVISNLVKYMGANQGGLFIINDDNKDDIFIEIKAVYAYDRKKILKQRIEIGENIVGRCVLEEKSIYITDLPNNYINITSGLGEANPTALLVSPLIFNQKVYGIVEIAFFDTIENYKIEFIEKIGESIASTISSVKTNIVTNKLFEEAKIKSQQFELQKEAMQQNNKELKAAHEKLQEESDALKIKHKDILNERVTILEKQDYYKRLLDISKGNVEKKENELKKLRGLVERLKHKR